MLLVSDYLVLTADGKGNSGASCVLKSPFVALWSCDVPDPLMPPGKIKRRCLMGGGAAGGGDGGAEEKMGDRGRKNRKKTSTCSY